MVFTVHYEAMAQGYSANTAGDPRVPNWVDLTLPDAWPDRLNFSNPLAVVRLVVSALRSERPLVDLPADLPGADAIPRYILQEFHNLPNGNYSKSITRGYVTWFDRVMLGHMQQSRDAVAAQLGHLDSVLDVGCAGGHMAQALLDAGSRDVWGLDPSPYLLQHAAARYPAVKFVQGIAENTGFRDGRFGGATACFLMHELPPRYLDAALAELRRVIRPGGLLAVIEPSPEQINESLPKLTLRHGWRGIYFGLLARRMHEPFVHAWQKQPIASKLAEFGFRLDEDRNELPIRHILATRLADD
ncbi:MAG: class I SAM-dependent methyltransferase [Halioglobus sp.]|nr:class I SAM-dependent methyltransferase [Halioglobus sp.]